MSARTPRCVSWQKLLAHARRAGVPPSGVPAWLRRKFGTIVIAKIRADGTIGCGHPCPMCRKALERVGARVATIVDDASMVVYRGPIAKAPPSRPTAKQRGVMGWVESAPESRT